MVKKLPASTGDTGDRGSIPGSGRSHGGGNGNPLQYSCLENSMGRGARWATVHGVAKGLTNWVHTHTLQEKDGISQDASCPLWVMNATGIRCKDQLAVSF